MIIKYSNIKNNYFFEFMPQLDTASFWEIAIFTFVVYFALYILFDIYSRNINFYEKCLSYKKILTYAIYEKTTRVNKQLNIFGWISN